jgi:lipopolysaccharide biosynthesis glycosyltransferase
LFLSKLYNNIDKILYLDSDLVVQKDLWRLYSKDMTGKLLLGVLDPISGLEGFDLDYMNSGVLLMNLRDMRQTEMIQRLYDDFETMPSNLKNYFDQDTINMILKKQKDTLSSKWNISLVPEVPLFINHFVDQKPWRGNLEKLWVEDRSNLTKPTSYYWYYRDITPWSTKLDLLNSVIGSNSVISAN